MKHELKSFTDRDWELLIKDLETDKLINTTKTKELRKDLKEYRAQRDELTVLLSQLEAVDVVSHDDVKEHEFKISNLKIIQPFNGQSKTK